jgi:hypothetical protein
MKPDPNSRMKKSGEKTPANGEIPPQVRGNGHSNVSPQGASGTAEVESESEISQMSVETLPGAFEASDQFYRVVRKETLPIKADRDVVDSVAAVNGGEEQVRAYHRSLFFADEPRAAKDQVLRQTIADVQDNIASGMAHEAKRKAELDRTEQDLREDAKPQVWHVSTRVLVVAMFAIAAVYVAAEIRNGMVFCLMSGRELLQNPVMAFLISLVPCTGVGVFLELLSLQCQTDRARWLFKVVLGVAGLVAAAAAIPLFAMTYAGFLREPGEVMANGGGDGFAPAVTIGLQIVLCSLAAGALVIFALGIIEKHRGPARIDNPAWLKIKKDLDEISRVLRKDRELLGFAQGKLNALLADLDRLLGEAVAAYRLARQPWELREQRARESVEALDRMLPRKRK